MEDEKRSLSADTFLAQQRNARRERVQKIRHTQRRTFLDRDLGEAPPQIHQQHLCPGCIERVVPCQQRASDHVTHLELQIRQLGLIRTKAIYY